MTVLPNVNQAIGVYAVESETDLQSRVEDIGEGALTIAMPSDGRSERLLQCGSVVYLNWISPRGVVRVRGVVGALLHVPIPSLLVAFAGEPEIQQRRNTVRASINLPVRATADWARAAGEQALPIRGTTFDLSGGGMRVRLQGYKAGLDERLAFAITMPGDSLVEAVGRVTRRPMPDVYCVEFDEIDMRAQEHIVQLVFERLRCLSGRVA